VVKNEENIAVSEGEVLTESFLSPPRSNCSTTGKFQSKRYMDEVLLPKIAGYSISAYI